MKALTLTQPWASLVAHGIKKYETRSWSTSYRGPLAIHAAKTIPAPAREFLLNNVVAQASRTGAIRTFGHYPLGEIVATCDLVDVIHTEGKAWITDLERRLGDWTPGRYAWELRNVQIMTPEPARGALGLWTWNGRLLT